MNSDPNSDSELCTESKLSRVYSTHTLTQAARTLPLDRVHNAISWRTERHVVAMPDRVTGRAAALTGRVTRAHGFVVAPSSHDTKIVLRPKPCRPLCRTSCRACRSVVSRTHAAVSQRCRSLYLDPKGRP